jgi:hypothetical protein
MWIPPKKSGRLHDLAGLAVAALGNLLSDPGALDRMTSICGETFDGRDLA